MRDDRTPDKKYRTDQQSRNSINQQMRQSPSGTNGIVLDYDPVTNNAVVLLAQPNSDAQGEILTDVPCPAMIGVQHQAPEAGRGCWVQFKGSDMTFPIITHYFNYNYEKFDYSKQNQAVNPLPRFMLDM